MGLLLQVPQVVVESARARIGAVEDGLDGPGLFLSRRQRDQLGELVLEPEPVIERHVDRVEVRPPVHGDRVVEGDAQLHPDAHEQVIGQVADPELARVRVLRRDRQDAVRLIDRRGDADLRGAAAGPPRPGPAGGSRRSASSARRHRSRPGRGPAGIASWPWSSGFAAPLQLAEAARASCRRRGSCSSGPSQFRSSASSPSAKLGASSSPMKSRAYCSRMSPTFASGSQPRPLQTNLLTSSLQPSE